MLSTRPGLYGISKRDLEFGNVELLLPLNGADGSTTIDDFSNNSYAITVNGDAQIDTAQSKYGDSSLLLDGTGDYLGFSTAVLSPGSSDFTLEYWVRFNSLSGNVSVISARSAPPQYRGILMVTRSGVMSVYMSTNGTSFNIANAASIGGSLSTSTWYHFALVRDGGNIYGFLDGTKTTISTGAGSASLSSATQARIGYDVGFATYLNGWIDDFRMTIGTARYTADFTPPRQHPTR